MQKEGKNMNKTNDKIMETHISGLKCDNPKCDWKDMSIPLNEYPNWVGKRCPKCGEVVLTEKDWNTVQKLICIENFINKFSKFVPKKCKKEKTLFEVSMNGTGKIN